MTLPLGALSSNRSPQESIKKAIKGPMKEFFSRKPVMQSGPTLCLSDPSLSSKW